MSIPAPAGTGVDRIYAVQAGTPAGHERKRHCLHAMEATIAQLR